MNVLKLHKRIEIALFPSMSPDVTYPISLVIGIKLIPYDEI
jgi:hypothetical protein